MFELRSLSEADLEGIHAATLDAFAVYPIPMQPSLAALQLMLHRRGVVWPLSLGAFKGAELVGYTLSARSGRSAYDLMTGVRRAAQGGGLVGALFGALWPRLRAEGIERMTLEVIDTNDRAVRAYARLGFVRARRLICLKWPEPKVTVTRAVPAGLELVETATLDWPTWSAWWDFQPAWPGGIETVERSEPRVVLEARIGDQVRGVAIACGSDVLQIAIAPDQRRRGIASALLHELQRRSADPLRVLNVDARAIAALACLRHCGARPLIDQWEMIRELT
ncbi:GNAT family N-acetyltransferase [Enhygromyxa salina]|uniref:Putative acetyltransferase n=1 Tax=Enhygromyxa salina TaxID=215803 RepID=A0A2S9YKA1_9BACT|nr:GNAT family N-acetyltransferase [Enhygromyxa salina]PRQ05530.1 putative acetyltransferase [Enhygromyxa salina]